MRFSVYPEYTPEARAQYAKSVLTILASPTLGTKGAVRLPSTFIYIDGVLVHIGGGGGTWQRAGSTMYLPGESPEVGYIARLGTVCCMVVALGLDEDPAIQEAIAKAFETGIKSGRVAQHTIILAKVTPSQLASAPDLSQFAAKLDGKWYSPSGLEVEVPATWTIMDC